MEKLTICYEFDFRFTVRKRNGKTYKGHYVNAIGLNFRLALWDAYYILKKRKSQIIAIQAVKPLRVAFAFDAQQRSVKINISDYPPDIPQDYTKELAQLPGFNN